MCTVYEFATLELLVVLLNQKKHLYIDQKSKEQYDEAKHYGISLGIPEYQVDFAPDDKIWEK